MLSRVIVANLSSSRYLSGSDISDSGLSWMEFNGICLDPILAR